MRPASCTENMPRVLALAIAFGAVMLVRAITAGALERFDLPELVGYALLAIGSGTISVLLDPGLRAWVLGAFASAGTPQRRKRAFKGKVGRSGQRGQSASTTTINSSSAW